MTHQEKNALLSLVSGAIVFVLYVYFVGQMYQEGAFEGPGAGVQIGKSILWLIFGGIAVHVMVQIIFGIARAAMTREVASPPVVDERDRLIELRALRVAYYVIGAGFVGAMIALALGQTYFLTFNIIVFSFFVSGVAEGLVQLFLYRRGF